MKHLSRHHIQELILHKIVKFPPLKKREIGYGDAVFATAEEIKQCSPHYPVELLHEYNNPETNEIGYLVPYYFEQLLQYYQETPAITEEIKNFDILTSNLVALDNKSEAVKAKELLHESSSKLASLFYDNNEVMNILEPKFWHNVVQNSISKYNKIEYFAQWLSELFENEQDIIAFQNLVRIQNFSNTNLRDVLQYKTLMKALGNVEDYSLQTIAPILEHMIVSNSLPSQELAVKMLKKYDFKHTKDLYIQAYAQSKNDGFTQILKKILLHNNALPKIDNLFINQEDSIIYTSKINLDFMHLRNKAHDNGVVALSLVNIVIQASKKEYLRLTSTVSPDSKIIIIEAQYNDKNKMEYFTNDMLEKIQCAYHEMYLDDLRYNKLKNNAGNKINKNDVTDFLEKFEMWQFRNELHDSLPLSNIKSSRPKI